VEVNAFKGLRGKSASGLAAMILHVIARCLHNLL
jgi:hypothetical protein